MCILVSASDHATAAPEAPAPMMRTSTGLFILVPYPTFRRSGMVRRTRPGTSRFRARLFEAPRNDNLVHDPHRHRADAADEIRIEPFHRPGDLETHLPLQYLL